MAASDARCHTKDCCGHQLKKQDGGKNNFDNLVQDYHPFFPIPFNLRMTPAVSIKILTFFWSLWRWKRHGPLYII